MGLVSKVQSEKSYILRVPPSRVPTAMQCPANYLVRWAGREPLLRARAGREGLPRQTAPQGLRLPGPLQVAGPELVTAPTGPSCLLPMDTTSVTSVTSVTWGSPGEMQDVWLRPLECQCPQFPSVRPAHVLLSLPGRPLEISGEVWPCPLECGCGSGELGLRSRLWLSPGVMRWAFEHKKPRKK